MRAIHLMAVSARGTGAEHVSIEWLDALAAALARELRISCHVLTDSFDATAALEPGRRQYHSTAILRALAPHTAGEDVRLLAVTELDLYVPILTFVFGEAQLGGNCAIVSLHRLREEFYGLPPNALLTRERLEKEALHELGHTLGLRHCRDWQCAMASSHSVELLDLKDARYCDACRRVVSPG